MESFISDYKKYFWPTKSAVAIEDTSTSERWTVVLSDAGKTAKIDMLIQHVKSEFEFTLSSSTLSQNIPSIGIVRNQATVTDVDESWKPIALLGPSLVVQMRGKAHDSTISHLGLAHLANEDGFASFQRQLDTLLLKCNGEIEIFIGGGTSSSKRLWEKVRGEIDKVNQVHHNRLTLADDCYGVIDLATLYFQQNSQTYTGTASIQTAGFDDNNHPFMIVTANFPEGTPEIRDGVLYCASDRDYRIKV